MSSLLITKFEMPAGYPWVTHTCGNIYPWEMGMGMGMGKGQKFTLPMGTGMGYHTHLSPLSWTKFF